MRVRPAAAFQTGRIKRFKFASHFSSWGAPSRGRFRSGCQRRRLDVTLKNGKAVYQDKTDPRGSFTTGNLEAGAYNLELQSQKSMNQGTAVGDLPLDRQGSAAAIER